MPQTELDALLGALLGLVKSPAAKFRLRDILPFEISLVDRAANRRRFLTVKQANGVESMKLSKVDLPKDVRETVSKALGDALQQLIDITKAVDEGQAIDSSELPGEFIEAFSAMYDALGGVVDVHKDLPSRLGTETSDKLKAIAAVMATIAEADNPEAVTGMLERMLKVSAGDTDTAKTLKALGELSIALVSGDEEKVVSEDALIKTQTVLKTLGALVESQTPAEPPATDPAPEPPAVDPAATPEGTTKTDPAPVDSATPPTSDPVDPAPTAKTEPAPVDPAPADPAASTDPAPESTVKTDPAPADPAVSPEDVSTDTDPIVTKAADTVSVMAAEIAKSGAKMSAKRLKHFQSALKVLSDLLEDLSPVTKSDVTPEPPVVTPPAEPPVVTPPVETPSDTPTVAEIAKRLQTLDEKFSNLANKPVAPVSRRVDQNPGAGDPTLTQGTKPNKWVA